MSFLRSFSALQRGFTLLLHFGCGLRHFLESMWYSVKSIVYHVSPAEPGVSPTNSLLGLRMPPDRELVHSFRCERPPC